MNIAKSSGASSLYIDENGYVGLGTANPAYLFDLTGSSTDYLARIYNTNTGTTSSGLYIRSDGTSGNLLTLNFGGSDIVNISGAQSTFNNPVLFGSAGDVTMAENLNFTNDTAAYINFQGPGYIRTFSGYKNLDLTLSAANAGQVIVDDALTVTGTTTLGSTAISPNASSRGYILMADANGDAYWQATSTLGLYRLRCRYGKFRLDRPARLLRNGRHGRKRYFYNIYFTKRQCGNRHIFARAYFPGSWYISGVANFERLTSATDSGARVLDLLAVSSGDMEDGFGAGMGFYIEDISGVENSIGRIYAQRDGVDNEGQLQFFAGTDGGDIIMTMKSSGNVGIGTTSPLTTLSLQGTAGTPLLNIASSTGASAVYVDEYGRVGIGTAAPIADLYVAGSIFSGGGGIPLLMSVGAIRLRMRL